MSDNSEQSKLYRKVASNAKSTIRLKKIFTFLLVAYIIVFFMIYAKNKYGNANNDIYEKVGAGIETNITIEKTLKLKKLSIDRYKQYLRSQDYGSAYDMFTPEYKNYCDFDSFLGRVSGVDWTTLDVEDINAKNDYCYVATVVYTHNNELLKSKYLLYVDRYFTDSITISPDSFVCSYKDQDFEKDGVSLYIDECVVYIDKVTLKGSIENTSWFSDINVTSVDSAYGSSLVAHYPIIKELKKGEKMPFDIVFDGKAEFFIPDNIKIETENGDKKATYSFYFKESK